jgi:hypothetical protein
MKTRYFRATPERPHDRALRLAVAIARYRKWDEELTQIHGPMYYREMRFSVH